MGSKNRDLAAEADRLDTSAKSARAHMHLTQVERSRDISERLDGLEDRQTKASAAAASARTNAEAERSMAEAMELREKQLRSAADAARADGKIDKANDLDGAAVRASAAVQSHRDRAARRTADAERYETESKDMAGPVNDARAELSQLAREVEAADKEIDKLEHKARLLKDAHAKATGDDPVAKLDVDGLIEEADAIQVDVAKIEAIESDGGWNRHDEDDPAPTPMALPNDGPSQAEARRLAERDRPEMSREKQADLDADDAAQVRELATTRRAEAQGEFEQEAVRLRLARNDAARDEYAAREEAKAAEMQVKRENRAFTEAREKFEGLVKQAHENTDPAKAGQLNDLANRAESDLRIANARLEAAQAAVGTQTAIAEQKHRDVADLEAKFGTLQRERTETEKAIDGLEERARLLEQAQAKLAEADRTNNPRLRKEAEALVDKAEHVKVDQDALELEKGGPTEEPSTDPVPDPATAGQPGQPVPPTDQASYEKAAIDLTTRRDQVARDQWEAEKGSKAAQMQVQREQAKVDQARATVERLNRDADAVAAKDPARAEYLREQAQKAVSDQRVAEAELQEAQDTVTELSTQSAAAKQQIIELERQTTELRQQWENASTDEKIQPTPPAAGDLTEADLRELSTRYTTAAQAAHARRLDEARTVDADEKDFTDKRLEWQGAKAKLQRVEELRAKAKTEVDEHRANFERLSIEAAELDRKNPGSKAVEEKLEEAELELARVEGTQANLKDLDRRQADLSATVESLDQQRKSHLATLDAKLKRLDETADTLDDASREMGAAYRERHKAEQLRAQAAKPDTDPTVRAQLEKQAQEAEARSTQALAKARQIMPDDAAIQKALADAGVPDPAVAPASEPPPPPPNQPTDGKLGQDGVTMVNDPNDLGQPGQPDGTVQTASTDDVVGDEELAGNQAGSEVDPSSDEQPAGVRTAAVTTTAGTGDDLTVGDENVSEPRAVMAETPPESSGLAYAEQSPSEHEVDGYDDGMAEGDGSAGDNSAPPQTVAMDSDYTEPTPDSASEPAMASDYGDQFDDSSNEVEGIPS